MKSTIEQDGLKLAYPWSFERSNQMREQAHDIIPGGCHSLSKGDDQYPELSPGFFVRGSGCHVWDVDGNRFIEYGMGLRAVTLGHAYPSVVEAAYQQMLQGNNFTRPASVEVECAEELLGLIENADMVKFTKNGSTATSAAVKIARAYTGRDHVAICEDHPMLSHNDWFVATTELDAGIPMAYRDLTVKFRYNDIESVKALFDRYPGEIACVMMEAARTEEPRENFLHQTRRLCHDNGALFILDEMITGFRWHLNGAQKEYNIEADLATYGKALANGFSVAALTGKREFMELGGLRHKRERLYVLSSTHGAETPSLAAAIKTMRIYREQNVVEKLYRQGQRLKDGVEDVAGSLGLQHWFQVIGRPCNLAYVTRDPDGKSSQPYRTLFMQEIIRRGVIGPSFVISISHTDDIIDQTVEAVGEALKVYKSALENGVEDYLVGRSVQPADRRYN